MTRCLGIRKIAQAQVILILMNDQSPTQKVFRCNVRNQVTILTGAGSYLFNIPQISCMPLLSLLLTAWLRSMILRRTHMKVLTGPLTSFASQITSPMYMEAMLPLRKLCKGGLESGLSLFQGGDRMSLNRGYLIEDRHNGCHSI